nr:fimbria/pilus outer membrane usher protein [Escherichia coli]
NINIPQAWMEYSDASWLPPSRWDDGIPGIIFDYNITGTINNFHKNEQSKYLSYNGTAGANLGAWRLRADYQGNDYNSGQRSHVNYNQFSWSRLYLFRPIPEWRANFTLGENNISSDIFNTWSYAGATLESDDRMLPPKLRGYAPQVSGVADTNARVIIRQQGRILYNSTVPAGPFTIRDLDSSIRGRLDVEIIEQNGQKKTFQIDTASVPYLTRPGQVRFKIAAGRSRYYGHNLEGPVFTTGEASWGISNKWSLYGGGIFAGDYNAISVGLGHDLGKLGTISSDITQSIASLPQKEKQQGKS